MALRLSVTLQATASESRLSVMNNSRLKFRIIWYLQVSRLYLGVLEHLEMTQRVVEHRLVVL